MVNKRILTLCILGALSVLSLAAPSLIKYDTSGPSVIIYPPDGTVIPLYMTQIESYSVSSVPDPGEVMLGYTYTFTINCQSVGNAMDNVLALMTDNQIEVTMGYDAAFQLYTYLEANL